MPDPGILLCTPECLRPRRTQRLSVYRFTPENGDWLEVTVPTNGGELAARAEAARVSDPERWPKGWVDDSTTVVTLVRTTLPDPRPPIFEGFQRTSIF
jgi:hypothetical protein